MKTLLILLALGGGYYVYKKGSVTVTQLPQDIQLTKIVEIQEQRIVPVPMPSPFIMPARLNDTTYYRGKAYARS